MKKVIALVSFCFVFIFIVLFQYGCKTQGEEREMTKEELIAKGKYLTTVAGCNDCHTPKIYNDQGMQFDTTRILSGHPSDAMIPGYDKTMVEPGKWTLANNHFTAWIGPWGISYSANLTPDNETGIGTLSEEMFIKTLREGKWMGVGRPLLPPMPWQTIGYMTDDDLKAIYAYLMSLKPIKNKVPDPVPPSM